MLTVLRAIGVERRDRLVDIGVQLGAALDKELWLCGLPLVLGLVAIVLIDVLYCCVVLLCCVCVVLLCCVCELK